MSTHLLSIQQPESYPPSTSRRKASHSATAPGQPSGRIVTVSGPYGAGKNTVIPSAQNLLPPDSTFFSVSWTTRQPRINNGKLEQNGLEYHFKTTRQFQAAIQRGLNALKRGLKPLDIKTGMAEWEGDYNKSVKSDGKLTGDYYGTPRNPIYRALKQAKTIFMDLTWLSDSPNSGVRKIRADYPEQTLSVYVLPINGRQNPTIPQYVEEAAFRMTERAKRFSQDGELSEKDKAKIKQRSEQNLTDITTFFSLAPKDNPFDYWILNPRDNSSEAIAALSWIARNGKRRPVDMKLEPISTPQQAEAITKGYEQSSPSILTQHSNWIA